MRKLFYMGLEPYEGRYTLQLEEWSRRAFIRRGIDWVNVPGTTIDRYIDIMQGNGEQWRRDSNRYRDYVAETKY